jgi:hypothetical protein
MPARLLLESAADGGRPTAHLWFGGQAGTFVPVEPGTAPVLSDLVGTYANDELGSEIVVSNRGGQMYIHYGPPFHGASGAVAGAVAPDVYWVRVTTPGARYEHAVRFRRENGRVVGVVISSDRVKDVPFDRVSQ